MGILRHTWHNEGKPENRLLQNTAAGGFVVDNAAGSVLL